MIHAMKLLVLFFVVSLALVKCSYFGKSRGWSAADFPNPMTDPLKCGRKEVPRSQVCDPDVVLTKAIQDEIEGHINFIKSGQAAVAVVRKMDLAHLSDDVEKAAEIFSRTLHDKWAVGTAEKNDGVVVFLSIEDRAVYISTGDGAKERLHGGAIQDIIQRMKPFLRRADYGGALVNCIIEVEMALSGKLITNPHGGAHAGTHDQDSEDKVAPFVIFILMFAGICGYSWYQSRKMARLERGRVALESLIREVDNTANSGEGNERVFLTTSCPICLEDFPAPLTEDTTQTGATGTGTATVPGIGGDSAGAGQRDDTAGSQLLRDLGPSPTAAVFTARTPTPRPNKPMALRCGHTFCHECITAHLKTEAGRRCPICRFPVHEDYDGLDPRQPAPRPPGQGQAPRPGADVQDPDDGTSCRRSATATGAGAEARAGLESVDTSEPSRVNQDPMYADTQSGYQSQSHSQSTSSSSSQAPHWGFGRRAPEIHYRLNRMRYLYPDIMTAQLLHNMNRAVDRGSLHDMRSELSARSVEIQHTVTQMREAAAKAARTSGSRGASGMSFGGGRSSGGGGGRW